MRAGDGYEQNHRELIAARILAAIGGLYLPDGKYHHGDTDHHHQNTDYGSRETGTTLSVSSIGRNASNGVTAVAERADPRDASTVTTIPKRIGMTRPAKRN